MAAGGGVRGRSGGWLTIAAAAALGCGPRRSDVPRVSFGPPCPPETPLYTGDSLVLGGPPGPLAGVVVDVESNAPVGGALIRWSGTAPGTAADSAGRFRLAAPDTAGVYRLEVRSIGYAGYRGQVAWRPGPSTDAAGGAPPRDTLVVRLLPRRCGWMS